MNATRTIPAWVRAALVALAALSIGLGVWALRLTGEKGELREARGRVLDAWAADADSARARLAEVEDDLEFAGGPDSDVRPLSGAGSHAGAGGRVFLDAEAGRAIVFAYDLPGVRVDQVYELWAIGPAGPRRAAVFRPDERGRARVEIEDAELLRDVRTLAVSVEPAPGVDEPTGDFVLSAGGS